MKLPGKLVLICGLSFAGKTTLGDAICAALGYVQVDVDAVKADLYGPDEADADLSPGEWSRIYGETDRRIESYLRAGPPGARSLRARWARRLRR